MYCAVVKSRWWPNPLLEFTQLNQNNRNTISRAHVWTVEVKYKLSILDSLALPESYAPPTPLTVTSESSMF